MLVNLESAAAARLTARNKLVANDGNYYACGFCIAPSSGDYHLLTHTRSAIAFLLWRNDDNQYVLSFGHTTAAEATATFYPLVTGITLGKTYVCYAEIQVDAGSDAKEIVRAGAVKASDFTGAAPWAALGGTSDSVETQLISSTAYPVVMAVAGPYGTNGGKFRADEIVVGTEKKDILPVGGVFAISPTGAPTVEMNAFSTDWILVADQGVTADAGIVYSTDETFVTATTNSLGTGLAADTRTASLTGLEPDMTYWWKIYADNGTETVETSVGSFITLGAPIFGTMTATVTEESAAFSVALTEAAMQNTLDTSVSIFYGTDGETWTELSLGSSATATNLSGAVENLGYGLKYKWFARATATLVNSRVLSVDSTTNSFATFWSGDIYVNAAAANATTPYATPETAAKTIATAMSVAAPGATIHVAPGRYPISTPISLTKAVKLVGDDDNPSYVVVSNTVSPNWNNKNFRCLFVNHESAWVSGLTFENGQQYFSGGNIMIDTNGGVISNCIIRAGMVRNDDAAGSNLAVKGPGLVTHCTIQGGYVGAESTESGKICSVYLEHESARIENCLVDGFVVPSSNTKGGCGLRVEKGAAVNCTVVNTQYNVEDADKQAKFAGINVTGSGVATNCVSSLNADPSGILRSFLPGQSGSLLVSCAYDGIAGSLEPLSGMVSPIVGTAESFFKDYANGDYTPKTGGPLVGKGANYEGMASVDLAGKPRLVGRKGVDIGCYESQKTSGFFIVVR